MAVKRIFFVIISLLCLIWVLPIHAADLMKKFHPHISVVGEYNDNLYLTSTNEKDDYITTISPGIKFANMDNVSGIDFDYTLGAVFYGKESDKDYISHNAQLSAKYLTAEHFNFYLRNSFVRSEDSREQEYFTPITSNLYVLSTQVTRDIYWRNVFAPTIEYQFGPENRMGVNYRNNIYETQAAGGDDSQENYINPFLTYWFNRHNGIQLEYGYTKGDFDIDPDFTGHMGRGRYTNRFSKRSSAFLEYTYTKRDFDAQDRDYEINEPSIGLTYAFTPSLTGSAQVGYYWMDPESGVEKDGITYRGDLTSLNREDRTTVTLSFQGGYTEDFFTSENAGFTKYHRITGSLNHRPTKKSSIGCFGSFERADYSMPDRSDDIWGAGLRGSYTILRWLTVSAEFSSRKRQSDVNTYDYTENRGTLQITAAY